MIWDPGGSVDLQLVKLRVDKRIEYEGFAPPLLSGGLPRQLANARTFTLALGRGSSFGDDGYTGSVRGSLRLTLLRRGHVTQHVITEPR